MELTKALRRRAACPPGATDRRPDLHLADPDSAHVHVPPPFVYVAALLAGWLLSRRWPLAWSLDGVAAGTVEVAGVFLVAAGVVLGAWSMALFRRAGTSPIPVKTTTVVVMDGPYRFTRNPMYLGLTTLMAGLGLMLANGWILVMTPLAMLGVEWLAIRREERYLEAKFGDLYRDYTRRVRRWI